jgi:hypothetical protein
MQLGQWLNLDREHSAATTAQVLADEATAALGFPITLNNISAARAALGIIPTGYAGAKSASTRRNTTQVLAAAVLHLYQERNLMPPADLAALAK